MVSGVVSVELRDGSFSQPSKVISEEAIAPAIGENSNAVIKVGTKTIVVLDALLYTFCVSGHQSALQFHHDARDSWWRIYLLVLH